MIFKMRVPIVHSTQLQRECAAHSTQLQRECEGTWEFHIPPWYHVYQQQPRHDLVYEFTRVVFAIHIASSIIETYFSKTKYIKNQYRASLCYSLSGGHDPSSSTTSATWTQRRTSKREWFPQWLEGCSKTHGKQFEWGRGRGRRRKLSGGEGE